MENFFKCQLEYFNKETNSWGVGNIIGISQEEDFLFQNKENLKLIRTKVEDIRLILSQTKEIDPNLSDKEIDYQIQPGYYVPCVINKRMGNFYSITIGGTARLTEKEFLRQVTTKPFKESEIHSQYENIFFNMPRPDWPLSENFKRMLTTIAEDTTIMHAIYDTTLRIFCEKEESIMIRFIIDTAIEKEIKLITIKSATSMELNKLNNLKNEMRKFKEFYISNKLTGLIIGSKGQNIKRLKQTYNVNIKVDTNLQGEEHLVTITGEDPNQVENCFNEINFVEKLFEIKEESVDKITNRLDELNRKYHLILKMTEGQYQDDYRGVYVIKYLSVIGKERSVQMMIKEISNHIIIN